MGLHSWDQFFGRCLVTAIKRPLGFCLSKMEAVCIIRFSLEASFFVWRKTVLLLEAYCVLLRLLTPA